jgi:hypothetical protein
VLHVLSQGEERAACVESGEKRAACALSQESSVLRVESGEERAACVPFFDTGEGQGDASIECTCQPAHHP